MINNYPLIKNSEFIKFFILFDNFHIFLNINHFKLIVIIIFNFISLLFYSIKLILFQKNKLYIIINH